MKIDDTSEFFARFAPTIRLICMNSKSKEKFDNIVDSKNVSLFGIPVSLNELIPDGKFVVTWSDGYTTII